MANEKRLIDANALKSFACEFCNSINSDEPCEPAECRCMRLIDEMPTVDAVEVVHGRIEKVEIIPNYMWKYRCSYCQSDMERWHNYCPNCGAKMDGDGNADV